MMAQKPGTEWDASAYHRLSDPQVSWGQEVLARLQLRGDESVIDAGCGTGRLTAEILDRLPRGQVIALDASENMLAAARNYLVPRFGERVVFVQADLQTLELEKVADAIVSTATFHWVTDHPRLFRGLFRALKPGGRLVAQCGGGPNIARVLQRAETLLDSPPYAPYFVGWRRPWEFADEVTTAARLKAAGFVEVETSVVPAPTVLPSKEVYRDFLTHVIFHAHLARVPESKLRDRFIAELTEQAAADEPPYMLDYWRLNLQGRRPP